MARWNSLVGAWLLRGDEREERQGCDPLSSQGAREGGRGLVPREQGVGGWDGEEGRRGARR